ncbi:hypothetical protein GJAV_G00256990 [Gymnothorax javanicus]|nr:hypothetical protein GJAV_G00256990 [Gymnothorax javanicus]
MECREIGGRRPCSIFILRCRCMSPSLLVFTEERMDQEVVYPAQSALEDECCLCTCFISRNTMIQPHHFLFVPALLCRSCISGQLLACLSAFSSYILPL